MSQSNIIRNETADAEQSAQFDQTMINRSIK
jgi:hypothetical protein